MRSRRWVVAVLILPFLGVLYPPLYAGIKPTLGGVPFFIWYQFAWTIVTAVLTISVYFIVHDDHAGEDA